MRQLRETTTSEEEEAAQDETISTTVSQVAGDITTPNRLDEPFVEMLSESWRETEAERGDGGVLAPLFGGILAVLAISAFSQVPIGQEDYSKYAAVKTSTEVDLGDLNADRIKATQGL